MRGSESKDCVKHAGQANGANRSQLDQTMAVLPDNQAGEGRHKCPYCAYEVGFKRGFRKAQDEAMKSISELRT